MVASLGLAFWPGRFAVGGHRGAGPERRFRWEQQQCTAFV